MRILQIIPHYLPATAFGGPLRVAYGLGQSLVNLGHEVVICTTNLKTDHEDLDVVIDSPVEYDGTVVYYEPTIISRYWGFSPRLYRRAHELIYRADIVLIHFHYQFANWAGAYLARKLRKPYVIFAHGSFNRWGITRNSQIKKKLYLRFFEHANIEDAAFIAFNAQEELQLSLFYDKGVVIPNGIDPAEFRSMPARGSWRKQQQGLEGKTVFLYLGRLNPRQKGLDMLVPAFAQLLNRRSDIHLILAGPDERGGEAETRSIVTTLGIQDHVTFTGNVDGAEKKGILQDSDVFTLTSPSEGTSIALLEAMYVGLPAIVTDRIGMSDRIQTQQCGLVVQRNVMQIASAMNKLARDIDQRKHFGREAHRLVEEEFTWDTIARDFVTIIRERTGI